MAYFNHAFKKSFLATGATQAGTLITLPDGTTVAATTSEGYLTSLGIPTYGLNQLSAQGTTTATILDGLIQKLIYQLILLLQLQYVVMHILQVLQFTLATRLDL